jgi:hypothetical protein
MEYNDVESIKDGQKEKKLGKKKPKKKSPMRGCAQLKTINWDKKAVRAQVLKCHEQRFLHYKSCR